MNRARGSGHHTTTHRELTPEERTAATRMVRRQARDRNDLRNLLDALGLNNQTTKDPS